MSDHDRGLAFDLTTLQSRRRALMLFGGAGLVTLVGCAADSGSPGTSDTATGCAEIPDETAGPFPADGSNGPNVLTESGIVRSDIRSSFGSASGTADGVPLAFLEEVCDAVYATDGYEASVGNLARTSLDDDMVFSDGYDSQLADVSGDTSAGYTATLVVTI